MRGIVPQKFPYLPQVGDEVSPFFHRKEQFGEAIAQHGLRGILDFELSRNRKQISAVFPY